MLSARFLQSPATPQRASSQDMKAEKTKSCNTCRQRICQSQNSTGVMRGTKRAAPELDYCETALCHCEHLSVPSLAFSTMLSLVLRCQHGLGLTLSQSPFSSPELLLLQGHLSENALNSVDLTFWGEKVFRKVLRLKQQTWLKEGVWCVNCNYEADDGDIPYNVAWVKSCTTSLQHSWVTTCQKSNTLCRVTVAAVTGNTCG